FFICPRVVARHQTNGQKERIDMADENPTNAVSATEATPKEQTQATTPAVATPTETPAEVMIPKHRYDEVSKKLKALEDDAAKKAADQQVADEKRMAEQQEWQKLYESRKAKVDELTPKAELADKLTAMVTEQYAATIKDWPEQVKAMAPADEADILTKLAWMQKATPLATELLGDKTPQGGNGRRPQPVSPANQAKAVEEQRQQWSRQAAQRYR
ncbi:MAG: hypothetical protein ACTS5I_00865, partial [Rhodanobacter sp.]